MTNRTQTPTSNCGQSRHPPTRAKCSGARSCPETRSRSLCTPAGWPWSSVATTALRAVNKGPTRQRDGCGPRHHVASCTQPCSPTAQPLARRDHAALRGLRIAPSARDLPASPRARPPRQAHKANTDPVPPATWPPIARGSPLRERSRLLSARAGRARLSTRLPARAHESARSYPPT